MLDNLFDIVFAFAQIVKRNGKVDGKGLACQAEFYLAEIDLWNIFLASSACWPQQRPPAVLHAANQVFL